MSKDDDYKMERLLVQCSWMMAISSIAFVATVLQHIPADQIETLIDTQHAMINKAFTDRDASPEAIKGCLDESNVFATLLLKQCLEGYELLATNNEGQEPS